jgi:RimJ/RimL family protein N-acetyltransferase
MRSRRTSTLIDPSAVKGVNLRPLRDDDRESMFLLESDAVGADMIAFLPRSPGDREAFDRHWERLHSDPLNVIRTIEVDGRYGGYALSFVVDGEREVGYWVERSLWGRGIATEALRRFVAELDERPLFAHTAADNEASRRVLEKSGFVLIAGAESFAPRREAVIPEFVFRLDA